MLHPFTVVALEDDERAGGRLRADRHGAVIQSLRVHGAAVIEGAVDPAIFTRLRDAMEADLDDAAAHPAALEVPGHVQHNPPLHAENLYPEVFANPVAVAIAEAMLGSGIQLSMYTGNTMLGHTTAQQPVHWDEPQLRPDADPAPPCASLTINIPLVDATEANGALEVWPGTHLGPRATRRPGGDQGLTVPEQWLEERRAQVPPVRVPAPAGSLLLRDGHMWHRGTTNSTPHPRPVVAIVYGAAWFRPLAIDFFPDARPVLEASGLRVYARYRDDFDPLAWPPSFAVVPAPMT